MSTGTGACRIAPAAASKLKQDFMALHEGLPARELVCEPWSGNPVKRVLGRATEIQYIKEIPDEVPSYHHPWAEQAQPKIGVDAAGQIKFASGRYETTRRGIEDRIRPGTNSPETLKYLKKPYVQAEKWPLVPGSLNTLGTLEFIRYKYQDGRTWREKSLIFPPETAPLIAHDEHGNLHALHGQYRISEERGVEGPMRARYGHRSHRRHNPASAVVPAGQMTAGKRAGRMVLNSLIVGAVGAGEIVLAGYLLKKVTWSAPVKALTKIGAGLGLGLGFAYALPGAPQVAAGVSVGGVIDGMMDLFNTYIAPRLMAAPTPAPVAQPTTPPAAQAFLPGGIPNQYSGYSPAACGVAAR